MQLDKTMKTPDLTDNIKTALLSQLKMKLMQNNATEQISI